MTQIYRTDDLAKWGTGKGSNLTAAEVDVNFWGAIQRIVAVEAATATIPAGIDRLTVSGTSFSVVLTDSTTLGPYTLPVATFRSRGNWAPLTAYAVLDTVTVNGGLYLVIFAHTSAATFSPTANDGAGDDYYSLLIQTPGSSLPTGGAVAQVLEKSTTANYAVTWGYKLPTSGTTGQVLKKNSNTNQDASWGTLDGSQVSFIGSTASTLTATTVTAAIEEVETNLQTLSSSVGGLSFGISDLADVRYATGDPQVGQILYFDGSSWKPIGVPSSGDSLVFDGSAWNATKLTDTVEFVIDGGGSVITTGMKGYIEVPFAATLTAVTMLGDQSGSVVVDVWKTTYSSFDGGVTHPAVGDSITASAKPTISSSTKSQDTTLTGWTTSISAGSILAFNVNSCSGIQRVTISLKVTR